MALTDAYATLDEYRDTIKSTATHDDARIMSGIAAASRMIDKATGRRFAKVDTANEREFPIPNGHRLVDIDDISAAPATVEVVDRSGNATAITGYTSMPTYASDLDEPFTQIELDDRAANGSTLRVTAVWGWPEVPEPIKQATMQIASILLLDGPRATNTVTNALDGSTRQMPASVNGPLRQIVAQYASRVEVGFGG